jgi:hypothetical protein
MFLDSGFAYSWWRPSHAGSFQDYIGSAAQWGGIVCLLLFKASKIVIALLLRPETDVFVYTRIGMMRDKEKTWLVGSGSEGTLTVV